MFRRIDHVELIPSDVGKTLDFYTEVLGFSVKSRKTLETGSMREVIYLALGDTVIEVLSVEAPNPAPQGPYHLGFRGIALEVGDMEEALSYLASKGVAATWGPVDLGASKRAEILDPDGFMIELREWKNEKAGV